MWIDENRPRYDRTELRYPSDLIDEEWSYIEPLIPSARRGGRKREVVIRERIAWSPCAVDPCEYGVAASNATRSNKSSAPPQQVGDPMVIREQRFSFNQVRQVLGGVLDEDPHAKRLDSLCGATLGVLRSSALAACSIGQGLAAARSLNPKRATKQVGRLLSNLKINVDDILTRWVPCVVGARTTIVAALDWTDFDADNPGLFNALN